MYSPLGGGLAGVPMRARPQMAEATLLKGDVLDSVSPPKSGSKESVKIRKHFPETWLWNQTNVGYGLMGKVINRMIYEAE